MKQPAQGVYNHMEKGYSRTSVFVWLLLTASLLLGVLFMLSTSQPASALTTVPTKMNFQGRLTDTSGNIKPNGTYNMRLKLYTVNSGGSAVWSEDRLVSATQGVQVTNGLFSIKLGDITTLPASLFASGELYLEVELPTPATATSASPVWTEGPMTPRNQMATSAYAYNSETLDGLDSDAFAQVAANNIYTGTNTFNVLGTNAFRIQNGSAVDVFKIDTTNSRIGLGTGSPTTTVHVASNTSVVNQPIFLVEQQGSGDSSIELKDSSGKSFYVGLDRSAGSSFKITSSSSLQSSSNVGTVSVGGSNIGSRDNVITAKKVITNAQGGNLASISVYVSSVDATNPGLKVALYGHDAGNNRPSSLVGSITTGQTLSVGWNTIPITATLTGSTVYWIAINAQGNSQFSYAYCGGCGGDSVYYSSQAYTNTWPTPLGAPTSTSNGEDWNWYMTYTYGAISDTFSGADLFKMSDTGAVTMQNSTNSASAFQVLNASSASLFTIDSTSSRVQIGSATGDTTGTVLILDTKSDAGDPTGVAGAMYYSSSAGKMRCFENGAWKDCDTGGSIASGTTAQRTASPAEGAQFFDTTTKQLLVYANGKWQGDRSGATKIVGMGAATGCTGSTPVPSLSSDGADYVVTSCTSAQTKILEAITSLGSQGGTVYLMEGTYIIDGTISLPSNVTINGSGPATILKLKNGINSDIGLFTVGSVNRVTINNLTLDGNKINNSAGTQTGISLGAAGSGSGASAIPGISLDSLEITNFRSDGIRHNGGTTANGSISRISTINNSGNGIFLFTSATNMSITNNLSHGNSGIGMDLYGVTNSTISGNTISGNGSEGGLKLNSPNNAVTNNTISANAAGISLAGNYQIVSDNNIYNNTGTGVVVGSSANYSSISNNYIGSNANGISLSSTSSITISDNTLRGNSGIAINVDLSQLSLISGNYLYDNGGTGSSSSIVLSAGCCGGSNDNRVIDNFITDTAGTGYAISITNGSRNYLSGNSYSGTGASSIFDSAVDTVYANQQDSNGNLINRGTNGFAVGALSASSTLTVQGGYVGQALSSPAQPTGATQGAAGTTSYSYVVTAYDGVGETLPSAARTITTGNATLNGTNFNRITWTRVSGAVSYKVYRTASAGTPATTGLIGTVAANVTLQLDDTGLAASSAVPTANTTGGSSFAGTLQGGSSLTLGTTSVAGSLVVSDGSSNTATISIGSLAGNYIYTLPVTTANDTFCMLTIANCSGGVTTVGTYSTINTSATGATISGNTITFQDASASAPGMMGTSTQTFAGNKTFNGTLTVNDVSVSAGKTITMVGGITSLRPASPSEGMVYFDTTTKQLITYENGKWQADRTTSTKIVAMGTATGCSGSSPVASQNPDSADYVVTSCTSAQTTINSAITALPAGGGTVYLMEGTYIIDGNILPNDNVTIAGAGKSTIIKFKNSTSTNVSGIYAVSKNRLVIRDLKIDGNKANNTGLAQDGIYMGSVGSGNGAAAVPGVTVEGVEIVNMARYGIHMNNSVNSSVSTSSVIASANRGIHMTTMTNNAISNSTVQGSGSDGVYVGGGTGGNIAGNVLEGSTGNGINIGAGTRIAITGNSIKSNTDAGIQMAGSGSSIAGNTIASNSTQGVYLAGNEHVITGNTIVSNTSSGIYLQTSSDNNINGNSIISNGSHGVYAWNSNHRNSITSNIIRDNGGTGANYGIYVNLSSTNWTISDNAITDTAGTGAAIRISNDSNYATLSNNTYSGTGASSIDDQNSTTIWSNQVDANGSLINRGRSVFSVNTTSTTSSFTLQGGMTNTQLPTPAQPTVARVGTAGTTTYGYRVTALDGTGETLASTERTITTANATLTGANYNTVTWVGIPGAVQYKIYRTTAGGTPSSTGLIGTVNGGVITFSDTGLAASTAVPAANTTGGLSIAGALQGTSAALTGKLVANGGLDFVDYAPFARFSSGRIALGSNGNTYAGMDFTIREDTAISSETNGYTFTRSGPTYLGANIGTQRLNVFNAPSYSGAFTLTNAATVAIGGAATAVGGAVITNNYSLWVQGGTVRMDAGTSDAVGQIIRGASGQSADLLQAQNNAGTVIAKIDASGQIQTPKVNFVSAGGGMSGLSYDTDNNIRFGVLNFGGGQGNVSIGQSADQTRGNGDGNVAIGRYAANGSGSFNVALGNGSGNNSTGGYNTSIGDSSGASITSGANNTFLGARAGNNDNDGTSVWRSLASAQNSTAIGSGAQVQSSNSLILGSVYNNTKVGIGITAPTNMLSVSPLVLHNSWATGFVQASQAGNTVTASSAQFSASNVGEILMWPDGTQTTITGYTSSTVVTVASSETRAASYFRTHKVGFQVASSGFVGIGTLNPGANLDVKTGVNTTTAFRIQDSSGVNLMVADTVNMRVTVRTLVVEYNLTVNGHIIGGGNAPTIAADSGGSCTNPTFAISGTDTAGKVTVTTGTGCASNDSIAAITFSSSFATSPYVVLTPANDNAAMLDAYIASVSTTGFIIYPKSTITPLSTTSYEWYYHAIQ